MAEVEVAVHRDAKGLSKPNLNPELSQQRRREFLLEWQKSRRDEIVDKLRALDDSEASESEGEEVDFLEQVDFKGREKLVRGTPAAIPEEQDNAIQIDQIITVNLSRGRGRGRGNGCLGFQPNIDEVDNTERSRGRGRGRFRFPQASSIADADWRVKKPESSSENLQIEKKATTTDETKPLTDKKPMKKRFRRKRPAPYGIMLSEWLIDAPENFEEDWVGVLCPVGKRCIVVACRGRTRVYTRRNDYLGQFSSCLPGGSNAHENNLSGTGRRGLTILDCLWSDKAQTFYVLDLICWNSYSVNNCTTDFRQFFLTSKFAEKPELTTSSTRNVVPFQPLPFFPVSELANVLSMGCPVFDDEIDGVIFYHRKVFYLPQVTPLVLWVHLSDMEVVLSVGVSPDLLARERVRHEKASYYLAKPNYNKKKATIDVGDEDSRDDYTIDEPCDEDGVPLG